MFALIVLILAVLILSRKGWPIWQAGLLSVGILVAGKLLTLGLAALLGLVFAGVGWAAMGDQGAVVLGAIASYGVLVISPVLTLALAHYVPKTAEAQREEQENVTHMVLCPSCGRSNASTTTVCPRCGTHSSA